MSSTKYVVIYNTSTGAIEVDPETGQQVLPGSFVAAQRSVVKDRVDTGELIIVDHEQITNLSSPNAWAAKQEYDRLTAAWEAEKAAAEPKAESKELPADYDDSSTKPATAKKQP